MQKALGFYQDFSRQNSLDPALQLETGRAHQRVAKIHELLGQQEEAEQAYREALAVFEDLIRGSPDRPDYRFELAATRNALGFQQTMVRRWEQAEDMLQRALPLVSGLVADFADRADYRFELSRNHNYQGNLWHRRGRRTLARTAFAQTVAVNQQLVEDFPEQPDYRRALALSYNNLQSAGLFLYMSRECRETRPVPRSRTSTDLFRLRAAGSEVKAAASAFCRISPARDTLEGIAEWWLLRQQIRVAVERVAQALHRLTAEGYDVWIDCQATGRLIGAS